jgi:hypothetical protein
MHTHTAQQSAVNSRASSLFNVIPSCVLLNFFIYWRRWDYDAAAAADELMLVAVTSLLAHRESEEIIL